MTHKSKYYYEQFLESMAQRNTRLEKNIQTNPDIREFYLMEKLYQVMRDDKKRGKRPSAKEFYLMEKLYQVMVKDKNRNESFRRQQN